MLDYENLDSHVVTVAHCESLIKGDRVKDLTPSHFVKKIRIVRDPLGLVEEVQRKS